MGDDKGVGEGEKVESGTTTTATASEVGKKKKKVRKGIFSRIWNGIFRINGDDFEKRLQYISKEEATVLARIKRRSQTWRPIIRYLIIFSLIFEAIAIGYAIVTTRTSDMNWKMRAFRVLPIFLLPAISSVTYSAFVSFTKMCDRKDQNTLEKLRAERQAKIDELKERTNYYTTQQLIQRYDPDPAAKAAAATVLASKLGADSGLKMFLGDEHEPNVQATMGKSKDVELVQSGGLRNRKHPNTHSISGEGTHQSPGSEDPAQTSEQSPLVVSHYNPTQGSSAHDGGWIARIAALLVGEDPTQSYALICGNCHMHNGETFRLTYY
uniref:Lunapark zinc ribbon domain-containing protein n=1 Tax=Cannabis sativa TaxID=3483 RepID=A0A803NGZ4_CANSA